MRKSKKSKHYNRGIQRYRYVSLQTSRCTCCSEGGASMKWLQGQETNKLGFFLLFCFSPAHPYFIERQTMQKIQCASRYLHFYIPVRKETLAMVSSLYSRNSWKTNICVSVLDQRVHVSRRITNRTGVAVALLLCATTFISAHDGAIIIFESIDSVCYGMHFTGYTCSW